MIYRMKRYASYYSVRDLMLNDTVRLGDHSRFQLINPGKSKFESVFNDYKNDDIVSDRLEMPSLIMSFVILASIVLTIIILFVKHVMAERKYERELEAEQSARTVCEELSSFPTSSSTEPFFQRQISTASTARRKSFLKSFREFRL